MRVYSRLTRRSMQKATPRYLEESFIRGVRWTLRDWPELEHGWINSQESSGTKSREGLFEDCGEDLG